MNPPAPRQPAALQRHAVDRSQILAWLRLKRETAELHARLEYLKLLVSLGVRRAEL